MYLSWGSENQKQQHVEIFQIWLILVANIKNKVENILLCLQSSNNIANVHIGDNSEKKLPTCGFYN